MASRDIRLVRRAESKAFTELSKLHGRDEIKNDIVNNWLVGSSDEIESDVKTTSVVDMGGVGKTAPAQLIYNDHAGKKVFLVLDDLWTDECKSWEQLNQGFKPAASGSRILVTTRKDTVVKAMNSVRKFPLKQLSGSVCLKIISQEAFIGRNEEQCRSLENIGKKIAERYLLQKDVYVPLLLSFFDLLPAWMAQGYLSSDENAEKEIRGAQYFDCLVEWSFFQDLEIFEGSIWGCKIHDITVDFAKFLMGNEVVSEDLHSDGKLSLENTRHLLVRQMRGTSFPVLLAAEKLWSLTIFDIHEEENSQALCKLFIEPKRVRSLNFYGAQIGGWPKEVGKLMHLRLLNLSHSMFARLPEAKLVPLRHLDTTGCSSLTYFPREIGRLTTLGDLWGIKVGLHHTIDNAFRLGDLENLCHLRVLMMKIVGSKTDANEARQAKLQRKIHLKYLELILDDSKDERMMLCWYEAALHIREAGEAKNM
ncbi:hypothetical protein SLEP1_g19017 [Rubroshorea leprosula]|nr:hypothetical protein SLEP1_g19017 [Rubroshorea leprosula]